MTDSTNSSQKPKAMTSYHASLDNFEKRERRQKSREYRAGKYSAPKSAVSSGRVATESRSGQNEQMVTFRGSKTLKLCHLGGLESVGQNMSFLEYGNNIVMIDAGFGFPTEDMPGVDYVIPDVSYLQENKRRIKALILTHGHMDHIGAIPYIIEKIGAPTIYGTNLTIGLLKEKLEEFGLNGRVKTVVVNPEKDVLSLGAFKVSFFRVNHNIPDTVGIIVDTPCGKIVHTGDFKFDLAPINEPTMDMDKVAKTGQDGVLALLIDSTGATKDGYTISESEIKKNLKEIFAGIKGRIFIASFSSLISRIQQIIDDTVAVNRKLTVTGRSMIVTIEVASRLGYLKVPRDLVITPQQAAKLPDDKIVVLSTGTQGEDSSALTKMSRGDHRFFKIRKGDTVILSSSIIPGNERQVVEVYDNLLRAGAKVLDYKQMDIHTSGHAHQEELKTTIRLFNPRFLVPVHGNRYMREACADMGRVLGMKEENIIVTDNGEVQEFDDTGKYTPLKLKVPTSFVLVDGLGVGDVGNIVLRDRQAMAEGGIFVIILTIDHKTMQIITSPDIISRGFVYMRAAEDLIRRSRQEVKNIFRHHIARQNVDMSYVKTVIREELGEFLFNETKRRPMVIPVIIEV